jgi:hypothetical protein
MYLMRLLLRLTRLARKPPSRQRLIFLAAVMVVSLVIVGIGALVADGGLGRLPIRRMLRLFH